MEPTKSPDIPPDLAPLYIAAQAYVIAAHGQTDFATAMSVQQSPAIRFSETCMSLFPMPSKFADAAAVAVVALIERIAQHQSVIADPERALGKAIELAAHLQLRNMALENRAQQAAAAPAPPSEPSRQGDAHVAQLRAALEAVDRLWTAGMTGSIDAMVDQAAVWQKVTEALAGRPAWFDIATEPPTKSTLLIFGKPGWDGLLIGFVCPDGHVHPLLGSADAPAPTVYHLLPAPLPAEGAS